MTMARLLEAEQRLVWADSLWKRYLFIGEASCYQGSVLERCSGAEVK
jgi:hypothetical protein